MARAHHIRQREERWQKHIMSLVREDEKCAVGLRNSYRFGLCSGDFCRAKETAVNARGLQAFVTKLTCAIGECEGHNDEVAAFDFANVRANILDNADRFVPMTRPSSLCSIC
jgi:hypothetical protein